MTKTMTRKNTDEEHDLGILENSDTQRTTHKLGLSKTGDWGYVGASYSRRESVYGIPVHADEHGDMVMKSMMMKNTVMRTMTMKSMATKITTNMTSTARMRRRAHFSTTKSDIWTIEGRINNVGSFINSIDFSYQDSDYSHVEQHAEGEEGTMKNTGMKSMTSTNTRVQHCLPMRLKSLTCASILTQTCIAPNRF